MKKLLMLMMIASLCGCGIVQSKKIEELQAKSKPEDWGVFTETDRKAGEIVATSLIKSMLKDPNSATFRFENPVRMIKIIKGEAERVWYTNIYVNAKNAFGGYVGDQRYVMVSKCYPNAVKNCEIAAFGVPNRRYPGDLDWVM